MIKKILNTQVRYHVMPNSGIDFQYENLTELIFIPDSLPVVTFKIDLKVCSQSPHSQIYFVLPFAINTVFFTPSSKPSRLSLITPC